MEDLTQTLFIITTLFNFLALEIYIFFFSPMAKQLERCKKRKREWGE